MVRIAEQEAEIKKYKRITRSLPPGPLKRDTLRHLRQLQNDLEECKMWLSKGACANASNRT